MKRSVEGKGKEKGGTVRVSKRGGMDEKRVEEGIRRKEGWMKRGMDGRMRKRREGGMDEKRGGRMGGERKD